MKRRILSAAVVIAAILTSVNANAQGPFPPMFSNKTHTAEAQPFADLSQQIWDFMVVHMGGYWDCAQELMIIGQGFIHYKHAEVYGVDVKQINDDNWAVYSTIKLDAALGGADNIVTTPFFVTQTFTREDGKWWMTAMVFTTRTAGPGIDPNAPAAH